MEHSDGRKWGTEETEESGDITKEHGDRTTVCPPLQWYSLMT